MIAPHVRAYHTQLRQILTQHADALARQTGFVQRRSPLTGSLFVLTLIMTIFQDTRRSLLSYTATLATLAPGVRISPQAFDQRVTSAAVAMLRALFAHVLALRAPISPARRQLLEQFSSVKLLDSTTISLPEALAEQFSGVGGKASPAAAKALVTLEWREGTIDDIEFVEGRTPDQGLGLRALAAALDNTLWLFDLGFWSCRFLSAIAEAKSWFVCRLQPRVTVREIVAGHERVVDVEVWLGDEVGRRWCAREVVLGRGAQQVACRLVAVQVPEAVANERRRKLRRAARKQGRQVQASTLLRQGYTLMVTNTSAEQLAAEALEEIYRIRWQIELLFKLAKSDAGLTQTQSEKADRALCELYAVWIAVVVVTHVRTLVAEQIEEVSLVKLWRRMKGAAVAWGTALARGAGAKALAELIEHVARYVRPTKRRAKPSTRDRIKALERGDTPDPVPPRPSTGAESRTRPCLA